MNIIGHNKQRNLLKSSFIDETIPHALLFNGDPSIGKKLVALELAKSFYCEKNSENNSNKIYGGCNDCLSCKLFNEGTIPDFYFVDCEDKENTKAENIRKLLYDLSLKNFSSKNKFIIFDNAHLLKEQSANILLKTLEEPKENTFFILITSNYSKLPITIVSRCHLWFFNNLSSDELREIIKEKDIKFQDNGDNIELLEGTLENINILSTNLSEKKAFEECIDSILSGDISSLTSLSKKISKDKDNIKYYLTLLRHIVREKMITEKDYNLKSVYALTLENIIFSEYMILDRYLSAQDVLNNVLINLLPNSNHKKLLDLTNVY